MPSFILSIIGDDRPGFVRDIAEVVTRHGGNWQESRMIQMANKFAGLVRVNTSADAVNQLKSDLHALAEGRFSLLVEALADIEDLDSATFRLDIVGNDRPGIIHEITTALASQAVNVIEMTSEVTPAAMSGTPLFICQAIVTQDADISFEATDLLLAKVAKDLALDIQVEEHSSEDHAHRAAS